MKTDTLELPAKSLISLIYRIGLFILLMMLFRKNLRTMESSRMETKFLIKIFKNT